MSEKDTPDPRRLAQEALEEAEGIKGRYANEKMLWGEAADLDDFADYIIELARALDAQVHVNEHLVKEHGNLTAEVVSLDEDNERLEAERERLERENARLLELVQFLRDEALSLAEEMLEGPYETMMVEATIEAIKEKTAAHRAKPGRGGGG